MDYGMNSGFENIPAYNSFQGGGLVSFAFIWLIMMAVFVVLFIALWKIFKKTGKPGWASIIPIYNYIVILEIVNRPIWWIILLFIPFINIIVSIIIMIDLAKAFGKGTGFGLGLTFLSFIFFPILGFGSAEYKGNTDQTFPTASSLTI